MNKLKLLVAIIFCIFAGFNLTACTGENYSTDLLAGGGGTETGNGIANKDSVVVRDSVVTRDSIIYVIDTLPKDATPTGVSVSGLAQKGPFINGSTVLVFELSDEKLTQTGKAFHGKTDNNGSFKISNIAISSKYAILEATGYFLNEITGKESSSPITLRTIADITSKEKININFLTQLAYDRITYLVLNKEMSIDQAKQQAEAEIIKTFFGTNAGENFENLNIFGSSEDDAKLLALSILILSDKSDAKFSKTLAEISEDIETDGSYDDEKTKLSMAEYAAFYMDFKSIRKNVEKIADGSVPDFEKAIYDYWTNTFGLGLCTAENEGEIKKNQNEKSAYSTTNFICKNNIWEPYYLNPTCDYGTFTDERDGKVYHTTQIGEQTWMAENLRYEGNGYSCYKDNPAYCKKSGLYYTYDQIECPSGWHLPSMNEWKTLFVAVGDTAVAADSLRSVGGWSVTRDPRIATTTDFHCFSVVAAGVVPFGDELGSAYYPSSNVLYPVGETTPVASENIVITPARNIRYSNMYFTVGTPVRCVKDAEE